MIGDAGPITIVEPQPGDVIPYVAEPRLPFVDYDTLSVDIDPVAVFDGATEYTILVLCDGAPDTGYTGWRRGISDSIDEPFTGDSINVPVACAGPEASFTVVGQALDVTDRVVAVSAAEGLTVSSEPLTLPAWEVDPGAEITLHLEQTPKPERIHLNATRGAQPAGWTKLRLADLVPDADATWRIPVAWGRVAEDVQACIESSTKDDWWGIACTATPFDPSAPIRFAADALEPGLEVTLTQDAVALAFSPEPTGGSVLIDVRTPTGFDAGDYRHWHILAPPGDRVVPLVELPLELESRLASDLTTSHAWTEYFRSPDMPDYETRRTQFVGYGIQRIDFTKGPHLLSRGETMVQVVVGTR
ncbi:MAG: hypothetical protein KTR31_37000 [Myxococcales bacterium]|nr:hypothetical protein [Myxococcales bacterium]